MGLTMFVVATLLLAVVGSSCGDGVPQDLSFIKATIEPYASCITGKLSCSADCKKIQFCLGGVLEDVRNCTTGTTCDAPTMTCKKSEEAQCGTIDPETFTCRGPVGGRFPNPYDCHSYFECKEPSETTTTTESVTTPTTTEPATTPTTTQPATTPTTTESVTTPTTMEATTTTGQRLVSVPRSSGAGVKHNCLEKTAYDSLSTTCRFKETHRVCTEGPVPACKAQFDMGPLIENPNIYYVCVNVNGVLQPWLAKCADPTTVFQDGKCVDPSYLRR